MIRRLLTPAILVIAACAPINRLRTPAYVDEWPAAVQRASLAADSGNYANAERILNAYSAQYPNTREAREALFWLGLYKLDPANKAGSMTEGLATLDKYLGDSTTLLYRTEATVLKRMSAATQLLQAKALTPPVRDTTIIKTSNEAEIAALKEQLAKTTAELERIKKRLANPNK